MPILIQMQIAVFNRIETNSTVNKKRLLCRQSFFEPELSTLREPLILPVAAKNFRMYDHYKAQ